jgi:hypothetical protein
MAIYLAVRCRADGCLNKEEHFIPLRLEQEDSTLPDVWSGPLFDAECAFGNSRQYDTRQVIIPPKPNFQTHPAFQQQNLPLRKKIVP